MGPEGLIPGNPTASKSPEAFQSSDNDEPMISSGEVFTKPSSLKPVSKNHTPVLLPTAIVFPSGFQTADNGHPRS